MAWVSKVNKWQKKAVLHSKAGSVGGSRAEAWASIMSASATRTYERSPRCPSPDVDWHTGSSMENATISTVLPW